VIGNKLKTVALGHFVTKLNIRIKRYE